MATFGQTVDGGKNHNINPGEKNCCKFTATETMNITKMTLLCKCDSGTSNIKMAIYENDVNDEPDALAKGENTNEGSVTTSLLEVDVLIVCTLSAGDYHLTFKMEHDGTARYSDSADPNQTQQDWVEDGYAANWTDPWNGHKDDLARELTIYATYTPAAPTGGYDCRDEVLLLQVDNEEIQEQNLMHEEMS